MQLLPLSQDWMGPGLLDFLYYNDDIIAVNHVESDFGGFLTL